MRRIIGIFVTLLALTMAPGASAQTDTRAPEIEAVIGQQLQAFNDRDVEAAWQFASPMIQGMFGTPQNFGTMVEQGYPMVWTNSEARFLDLREIGGRLWQKVMIRDAAGGLHVLDYQMIPTADGWQINGVQILPAPDVGV